MKKCKQTIVSRLAVPETDLGILREFITDSFLSLGPQHEPHLNKVLISFANVEIFRRTYLNSSSGESIFLVLEDQSNCKLAGCMAGIQCNPYELSLVRAYVDPQYRNQGLGKALTQNILDFAQTHGYERVVLKTISESGKALYLSMGFVEECEYFFWKAVNPVNSIQNLAILAGIHGNELIGIHLITQVWEKQRTFEKHPEMNITMLLGNQRAILSCQRFTEKDLNRCFALDDLQKQASVNEDCYEVTRAREINAILGKKQNIPGSIQSWKSANPLATEYMVDLHSSTSNMGICLIALVGNPMTLRLALVIQDFLAQSPIKFNVLLDTQCKRDVNNNADSITPSGLCYEVGPLAHGTLNSPLLLEWTQKVVERTVLFLSEFNACKEPTLSSRILEAFELWKPVYFPREAKDSPYISATLHPSLIGNDFQAIHPGSALFVDLATKSIICYEEEVVGFPCFIGEAAYFASGIAFWLCRKRVFPVYGKS